MGFDLHNGVGGVMGVVCCICKMEVLGAFREQDVTVVKETASLQINILFQRTIKILNMRFTEKEQ